MHLFKKYILTISVSFFSLFGYTQVNWVKHLDPVLKRSAMFPQWKGLAVADAFVMVDNDTLKMWFSGGGWLSNSTTCPRVRLGYAWSLDGIYWNEYGGNPVMDISADTSMFDADGIETPTVIKDLTASTNERYKLWYAGRKAQCSSTNDHKLGYAYSPDGLHWTKYQGNPVLVAGDNNNWFNSFVSGPSVIKEGATYKMWFTAPDLVINGQPTDGKGNIGYATSSDGISWTVSSSAVLIAGTQNNWDSASIAEPSVIKIGNTYHMFYSALDKWSIENFQVGYASSLNGINWIKSTSNPVLKVGTTNQWDRFWASHPAIMYDSLKNKFKMWYTGRDTATITSLLGYYWDIGYAESFFLSGTNSNADLKVYPNPSNDKLNILLPYPNQQFVIQIYSLLGQQLINTSDKTVINISNLATGIYILTVKQNNKVWTKKIFKQQLP